MRKLRVLSVFAGIGGFDLGLTRAGMEIVAAVEIDRFRRAVLKTHWPQTPLRRLLHQLQRDRNCCYPCGRRKLRTYCDHCSWRGRAPVNGPCPSCNAYGRLHLNLTANWEYVDA